MKRSPLWLLALALGMLTGCTYRGAVYAEYTHIGLGIRSAIEATAPVDVELGYGRGVFSLVPRREGDTAPGEAVSLISTQDVHTIATPVSPANQELLRVHAGFISGSAALAAVTPDGWQLVIVEPRAGSLPVMVKGPPQDRLAAAFQPTARFVIPAHQILQRLIDQANVRGDAEAVYGRAGIAVSDEFTRLFQPMQQRLTNRVAFIAAKNRYVENQPADTPRWREMISALEAALR